MSRRARSLGVLALAAAIVSLGSLAPAADAAAPQTNLPDVEDEVMCTICGTLLEESQSPQADRERELIRKLIARGETKKQIKEALVNQYGPRVLATPSGHGFDLTAWLVPILLIGAALGGLGVGAVRLSRRRRRAEPVAPLDPEDAAELDRDLSSYDL